MFYLLTYDITYDERKKSKLRKVEKICENYGVRVQNSVFELNINQADLITLKSKLDRVIDRNIDSVRIYELGKTYGEKLTLLGKREVFESTQDNSYLI